MSDVQKQPRRAPKDLPLTRLLPNMLTLLSLCSGLTAIRFALNAKWEHALIAIVIAGVFDMLDGRVARMLNIASKFGAELDSLSDLISFGVAPAFTIYEWALNDVRGVGWIAVLVYVVCAALRLARFNTMLDTATPVWAKSYFTGIPAPGGAGLAITPLAFYLAIGDDFQVPPVFMALWLIALGGMMVSRLPSFALKGWRIAPVWVAPIFAAVALLVAALVTSPWVTLSGIGSVYFISLPCAWLAYYLRLRRERTANV